MSAWAVLLGVSVALWSWAGVIDGLAAGDPVTILAAVVSLTVGGLLVESNFDGNEIADVVADNVDIHVTPTASDGDKEQRLNALANRFQQGQVKVASEENERWESFIREEWLPFPDASHDDRFDALEIASRGPDGSVDHVTDDEFEHLDW